MRGTTIKKPTVYVFDPVGFDLFDPKVHIRKGHRVVKTNLAGCPTNGTMGHCFVVDADTGEFLGLVLVNSLKKEVTP